MVARTSPDHAEPTGADTYSSAIVDAIGYSRWIVSRFAPYLRGTIVETGIGHGSYAPLLAEYGRYVGCDIDAQSVADARERFPGLAFEQCDVSDRARFLAIAGGGADAIVSINMLEHIEDDRRAAAALVDGLKPGGHVLISVPALELLYNDLDALAGHHRRYSRRSLAALFEGLPVEPVFVRYFNPIGGLGWLVNRLRRHSSLNDASVNAQIRIFDKYVLPVSKAIDPVTRGWFGQSAMFAGVRK